MIGAIDPDPRHRGAAVAQLRAAGIEVVDGVLAADCAAINLAFDRWLGLDRPWTIAKWAMTLDGKIATKSGDSRWISSPASRVRVHELRARVDAVIVGYRTATRDDPALTVREVEGPQPVRVVVDPRAELGRDLQLVRTAAEFPTWVVAADDADADALEREGVRVLRAPLTAPHRLDLAAAWRGLRDAGLRRVLVEGGGGLFAELWDADCIDQTVTYLAPRLIGGATAPTPCDGSGADRMADARHLDEFWCEPVGDDLRIVGIRGGTE